MGSINHLVQRIDNLCHDEVFGGTQILGYVDFAQGRANTNGIGYIEVDVQRYFAHNIGNTSQKPPCFLSC